MHETFLDDDLDTLVYRLAARTALLIISSRDDPDIVQRLSDYLQDRGAVGILLREYKKSESIEVLAQYYWESRIEKNASRFEDLVTTTLLSILSAVVANILTEMWKGELGPFAGLKKAGEKERLRILARKEPHFRRDFEKVNSFYVEKKNGTGVVSASVATSLFIHIKSGGKFDDFLSPSSTIKPSAGNSHPLTYASEVARGVIKTEIHHRNSPSVRKYYLDKRAVQLSDRLAFGEVLCLFDRDDLGLGADWPAVLRDRLRSARLYPDFWPAEVGPTHQSPKILILDDNVLRRMQNNNEVHWLKKCAGLISTGSSGMTGHLAVLSRNLGIGAVACRLTDEECRSAKFAFMHNGCLRLYNEVPNLTTADFIDLFSAMNRLDHPGD